LVAQNLQRAVDQLIVTSRSWVCCSERGHYANLLSTDARLGYASRLQTPYIDTTDQCLELYFQAQSTSPLSKPEISIIAVDEEQQETELASTMGLERTNWDRLFTRLPAGVHRVVVQGLRSLSGYSGMSVDDIVVQPCDKFGN